MIGEELAVNPGVGFPEVQRRITGTMARELLFDDVRLDCHAQMVRLSGEGRRRVVVGVIGLERRVPQIAPEYRRQPLLVGVGECGRDLLELPIGIFRAPVDCGADSGSAHVARLVHAGEQGLAIPARVGEQLVVVDLQDERNLVGVAPRHSAQDAERGSDSVAPALDRQANDVLRIEVDGVRSEGGSSGMLHTLIHREHR